MNEKKIKTVSSKKERTTYTLEYEIKIPVKFVCSFCNEENNYFQIIKYNKQIIKEKEEEFLDEEKNKIFEELEQSAKSSLDNLKEKIDKKNYSLLQVNQCFHCYKQSMWSLKYKYKSSIFLRALAYLFVTFMSFILNIVLQDVMQTLLKDVSNFLTSIFFFPTIFLIISIIALITDILAFNKKYDKMLEKYPLNKPIVEFDKIEINKNVYDTILENRLKM